MKEVTGHEWMNSAAVRIVNYKSELEINACVDVTQEIYLWCAAVVWGLNKWCAARGVLLVVCCWGVG